MNVREKIVRSSSFEKFSNSRIKTRTKRRNHCDELQLSVLNHETPNERL